ncbi:MAG: acyltransferase, partial [Alphaproteobacteria bacterium]|nr:acyltransferase [Alphaproteobacteria bacterium]
MVAYSHIGDFHHMAGTYAVFAFFILSGFLMTMVLEQVYLQRAGGVGDYLLNRFLRIYPLYWFAIALAALVATSGPLSLWKEIMMPHNFKEVLYNIIILAPMPKSSNDYCLLSVTWSLRAEIFFYLMLPVLLQWRRGYYTWLMVSAALLLFYIFGPLKFYQRYFTFWGAWPAFAAGSALFHFRHKLPRMPHAMGLGLMAVTVTLMCFNKPLLPQPKGAGFYLLLGLNILVVHYLSRLDVGRWRKLDA